MLPGLLLLMESARTGDLCVWPLRSLSTVSASSSSPLEQPIHLCWRARRSADWDDEEVRRLAESDAAAQQLLTAAYDVISQLLDVAPKRRKDDTPRPSRPKVSKRLVRPIDPDTCSHC